MKRLFGFLSLMILILNPLYSQDYQKEIDEQVWKPFIASFHHLDTYGFMSIHSKEVIRSPRASKVIMTWDEYFKSMSEWNDRCKKNSINVSIELRFTERIASADKAIDVGIYKTTTDEAKQPPRVSYGRFHVVLRKEKSVWKILVDTDSSEGGAIGEKDFLNAKEMGVQ